MRKKILFIAIIIAFSANFALAENVFKIGESWFINNQPKEEKQASNAPFKPFNWFYKGFSWVLGGIAQISHNIWDSEAKTYIGNIWKAAEGRWGKDFKKEIPGIRKELQKETNELKTEAPKAIKEIWTKANEIINKTFGGRKGE